MTEHQKDCSGGNETRGKILIHCSIYTQEDNRQRRKDTNTVGDTMLSPQRGVWVRILKEDSSGQSGPEHAMTQEAS